MSMAYGVMVYQSMVNWKPGPRSVYEAKEEGSEVGEVCSDALSNGNSKVINNMSKEQLQNNLPEGWTYTQHNGRVHIKDVTGNFRVGIAPPDKVTNYQHMHIYDANKNPLDLDVNIVDSRTRWTYTLEKLKLKR